MNRKPGIHCYSNSVGVLRSLPIWKDGLQYCCVGSEAFSIADLNFDRLGMGDTRRLSV